MVFATAIAFEKQGGDLPHADDLLRVYRLFEAAILELGHKPTWFGANDGKTRSQYRKYNGAFHGKVLGKGFSGYQNVSLVVNPVESDAPSADSFISFGFSFGPESKTISVSAVIHEPYMQYGSVECEKLIDDLAQVWPWDFGYVIKREIERSPEIFLLGALSDRMSAEDRQHVERWYVSSYSEQERRLSCIRDVFGYNMIGPGHLNRELHRGQTLREFIETDRSSMLSRLSDDLWLWKVADGKIGSVRKKLKGIDLILTE